MPNHRLRLVSVAVAVIERRGRYLISRRRLGDHLGGCWEFPGGQRRVGESWQACLQREVREELGVEIRPGRRLAPIRFTYPHKAVYLQPFDCAIVTGRPQALQVLDVKWVTPRQLSAFTFPPADRSLLDRLARLHHRRPPAILLSSS